MGTPHYVTVDNLNFITGAAVRRDGAPFPATQGSRPICAKQEHRVACVQNVVINATICTQWVQMTISGSSDRLYSIAEGQAGYFTSRQAREAGVDRSLLSRQVRTGRLYRVHHGLYRLVHFPAAPDEDLVVAWLQTGPASVISYDSALALHHLTDALPSEIHVTVPRAASHRRPGIRLHTNRLAPHEITHRNGVAVTTVSRTIADVAASGLSEEFVSQAVREALTNGLSTPEELLSAARSQRVRDLIRRSLEEALAP